MTKRSRRGPSGLALGIEVVVGLFILRPWFPAWRRRSVDDILAEGFSETQFSLAGGAVFILVTALVLFLFSRESGYFWIAVMAGADALLSVLVYLFALFTLKPQLRARSGAQQARADLGGVGEIQDIEALQKRREEIEQSLFERNLTDTFYLQAFSWQNVGIFEDGSYRFAPRVNVLLGKNGYGKTVLLRSLTALLQRDSAVSTQILTSGEGRLHVDLTRDGNLETIVRTARAFEDSVGKIPLLAIPDSRFVNRSVRTVTASSTGTQPLSYSGSLNFLTQQPYEDVIQELLSHMVIDYLYSGFGSPRGFRQPLFRLIEDVVRSLTDDKQFAFHSMEQRGRTGFEILVRTGGSPEMAIPLQYASQGTLSVVAIFGLIYSFLRSLRPQEREEDLLAVPAIVIIDELDAHLHPAWQQRILGLLTAKFPNVQFLVSAHSPVIVAGCDIGEVAVLRRRTPEAARGARPTKVFLGSTARDLSAYRQAAFDAITSLGMECVRMENFAASDAPPEKFTEWRVSECDLVVVLIGHLYGNCPPGIAESYTQLEYEAALRNKKPILAFVASDDFLLPANLYQNDASRDLQRAFRERVNRSSSAQQFSSPDALSVRIIEAIYSWQRSQQGSSGAGDLPPQPPRNGRYSVELLERDFLGATARDLYELVFEIEDIDRLYLEYTTKAAGAGGEKRSREIERLQDKDSLSPDEEQLLNRLIREDRLVRRAVEAREQRLKYEQTQAYIGQLESEIKRLQRALEVRPTNRGERGDVDAR
jgi:energy-coupling factor transporter ATP-binding protein EcfA2